MRNHLPQQQPWASSPHRTRAHDQASDAGAQDAGAQHAVPADLAQVDVVDPMELAHWTQYFGCSEGRLHEAVGLMGSDIARVRAYLRRFR